MAVLLASRRGFVVGGLAGAIGMAVWPGAKPLAAVPGLAPTASDTGFAPTPWYVLGPDGMADIWIAKAEIGQHIGTAQAQVIAEELELPWEQVRILYVPGHDPRYGAQITGGSTSVSTTFDTLSRAGAAGRVALVAAAAAQWSVPVGECSAAKGVVRHAASSRTLTYGDIVQHADPAAFFSEDEIKAVVLKQPSDCTLVGVSVPARDIPSKLDGTAKFGIDHSLDGQVYARPRLPPLRRGAKVLSVDDARARAAVPAYLGHVSIADPSDSLEGWVVAYATDWWSASKAANLLDVRYDLGSTNGGSTAGVDDAALQEHAKELQATSDEPEFVRVGDAGAALQSAGTRLEAVYLTGTNLQAQLEPLNAQAEQRDGVWHIYAGTQDVGQATQLLAKALEVPEAQVQMHQFPLGGAFGRKLDANFMIPAALTAKAIGRPVKLVFSREDDLGYSNPRLPTYQALRAGLGPDGKLAALSTDVVAGWPSIWIQPKSMLRDKQRDQRGIDPYAVAGADHWYDIPNQTVRAIENDLANRACPPGYLRGVAPGYTFWALESFMDECALSAGQDPLAFRLAHLSGAGMNAGDTPVTAGGGARLAAVLRQAADKAGYGKALPKDAAFGISASSGQDRKMPTWIGCVAQVAVDRATGMVDVRRLTLVVDVGRAVNPSAVRAQIEGAVLWGLSLALHEKCSIGKGRVVQANYDAFRPLRIDQQPSLDITLIKSDGFPSGIGEPGLTVAAPAIGNAIHAACGVRLRSLPMTPEAVLAGLQAKS